MRGVAPVRHRQDREEAKVAEEQHGLLRPGAQVEHHPTREPSQAGPLEDGHMVLRADPPQVPHAVDPSLRHQQASHPQQVEAIPQHAATHRQVPGLKPSQPAQMGGDQHSGDSQQGCVCGGGQVGTQGLKDRDPA